METAPDKGVSIWLNVYPPQLPDCLIRVGWLVCMIGCREHVSVASDNTYAPLCACECSAHVFTCPSSRLVVVVGGGGGYGPVAMFVLIATSLADRLFILFYINLCRMLLNVS